MQTSPNANHSPHLHVHPILTKQLFRTQVLSSQHNHLIQVQGKLVSLIIIAVDSYW